MKTLADIKKIAVLGAGTMGPGIAQTYAMGGYEVTMWTRSESTREKAIASLHAQLDTFEEEGLLKESKDAIMGRISFALTVEEAVKGADFIQETIVEKRDAKEELYAQLAAIVPSDVIIASNTSALNIFEVVPESLLPQQIICHWYAPPHVIPLVEVVKSDATSDETAETVMEELKAVGKEPVLCRKDVPGFIANRMQHALWREAISIVENGIADAETVDKAVRYSFGLRLPQLGPLENSDMVGTQLTYNIHSYILEHIEDSHKPSPVLRQMLDEGKLGFKSGEGFMKWTDEAVEKSNADLNEYLIRMLYGK